MRQNHNDIETMMLIIEVRIRFLVFFKRREVITFHIFSFSEGEACVCVVVVCGGGVVVVDGEKYNY